jgi:hypothetical protein
LEPLPKPVHVCYALACDLEPRYADLIAVSARCVRRIYPNARITVLTDHESLANIKYTIPRLSTVVSEIRPVGRLIGDPRRRSRFVKTQARNVLDGDFLYLDADTVPVGKFDKLFERAAPLSAAIDRNRVDPNGAFPEWVVPDFKQMGWRYPTKRYLNGGVVYWKDCSEARDLGRLWHETWLRYASKVLNPADQPSFNHSMDELGLEPEIMDDTFNARVGVSAQPASGVRIYHFCAEDNERPKGTILDALLAGYRQTGEVDFALIDRAVSRNDPWLEDVTA